MDRDHRPLFIEGGQMCRMELNTQWFNIWLKVEGRRVLRMATMFICCYSAGCGYADLMRKSEWLGIMTGERRLISDHRLSTLNTGLCLNKQTQIKTIKFHGSFFTRFMAGYNYIIPIDRDYTNDVLCNVKTTFIILLQII